MKFPIIPLFFACTAPLAGLIAQQASGEIPRTLGYWQFDEGDAGSTALTVRSSVNHPEMAGRATGYQQKPGPQYASEVPGAHILDGKNGTVLNDANTTSLRFEGEQATAGGIVTIQPGSLALSSEADFTIEAFVRSSATQNFSLIFGKKLSTSALSWSVDTSYKPGKLKIRADQLNPYQQAQAPGIETGIGRDGAWHHLALTFDADTRTFSLYEDYAKTGSLVAEGPLTLDDGPLMIGNFQSPDNTSGGGAFNGYIDEVRLSAGLLTPDEFLRAN